MLKASAPQKNQDREVDTALQSFQERHVDIMSTVQCLATKMSRNIRLEYTRIISLTKQKFCFSAESIAGERDSGWNTKTLTNLVMFNYINMPRVTSHPLTDLFNCAPWIEAIYMLRHLNVKFTMTNAFDGEELTLVSSTALKF